MGEEIVEAEKKEKKGKRKKKRKTNQEKRGDTEGSKEKRQSGLSVPEIVLRERRIAASEIVRECVRSILSGKPWS